MSPRVVSGAETCFSTVVGGAATADDGNGSFAQFADIVFGKKEAPWYDDAFMDGLIRFFLIMSPISRNLRRSRRLETISWREETVLSSDKNPTV